ncbi:MAG: hypothetical protein Q9170_007325 [Blastenia crenularia]
MPPGKKYESFVDPIRNQSGPGFDAHIYFHQENDEELRHAEELRERILQDFNELQTFKMHHEPIGPHPIGMFEVDIASPAQFGAFIPWLVIHHGPLSILVHPTTGDHLRDHTHHAMWIGEKLDLKLSIFEKFKTEQNTVRPERRQNTPDDGEDH